MKESFLEINNVSTNVFTYGKWVQDSFDSNKAEDIILVIPGNPGVTGFYDKFMQTLYEKTGYSVWIVGHAGHEIPRKGCAAPIQKLKGNECVFGLEGQIQHKKDFIKKYVPENTRIHLIGHSIGSYIALNLLKDETFNAKVVDVNLLFPTIEEMAESPNGKFLNFYVKPIVWLILFLSFIYTILPSLLQHALMFLYMKIVSMPKMHFKTLVNFIEPTILHKVFFMAFEELDQVKKRDSQIIKANLNKIRFVYGVTDGWAPPGYCDSLKEDIPDVDAQVTNFHHAFVLNESEEVGNFIGDWIAHKS